MFTFSGVIAELLDEFAAKYLMDGLGWLFGKGKKRSGSTEEGPGITQQTLNITLAERQEAMFVVYGAPVTLPGGTAPTEMIDPNALQQFETIHTSIGPKEGDKLEEALAAALKQLKNGIWPKAIETVVTRPPRQNNRRGGQQQQQPAGTTTTVQMTQHVPGWEPHNVYIRAFNEGFKDEPHAKKFYQVLTKENFLTADEKKRLKEETSKLLRRMAITWILILGLSFFGACVTALLVFATDHPIFFVATVVLGIIFFGTLSIPFKALSRNRS